MGTTGEQVHLESLESARVMFERLGRIEWVRQCDFALEGARAASARPAAQAAFEPVGNWRVQVSDGRLMNLRLLSNGTFEASQPGPFGLAFQAQGEWGFDRPSRALAFRGILNGFQPFALEIAFQGQCGNGYVGLGSDGLQYLFERP